MGSFYRLPSETSARGTARGNTWQARGAATASCRTYVASRSRVWQKLRGFSTHRPHGTVPRIYTSRATFPQQSPACGHDAGIVLSDQCWRREVAREDRAVVEQERHAVVGVARCGHNLACDADPLVHDGRTCGPSTVRLLPTSRRSASGVHSHVESVCRAYAARRLQATETFAEVLRKDLLRRRLDLLERPPLRGDDALKAMRVAHNFAELDVIP